jgi:hypothetical protein
VCEDSDLSFRAPNNVQWRTFANTIMGYHIRTPCWFLTNIHAYIFYATCENRYNLQFCNFAYNSLDLFNFKFKFNIENYNKNIGQYLKHKQLTSVSLKRQYCRSKYMAISIKIFCIIYTNSIQISVGRYVYNIRICIYNKFINALNDSEPLGSIKGR